MKQYITTIQWTGLVEPSYVIKQFLDSQRIHNLTFYLEKLHEAGVANSKHTTLLLNCLSKQKDVVKLNDFIKKKRLILTQKLLSKFVGNQDIQNMLLRSQRDFTNIIGL